MRLKKLKLAGFKSFVDPTTVSFPSALVAVVGPNGCGKSNIIDAVRWVMGESSAKNLRGESMADVIFNGSRDRKPVGQASVELIFENDAGRLLGEFASYSEIAIKRIVTRDGQSNYYLNGAKCRKKDVVDIFLGTGLGPRSYSIIGQGTISKIIEAKPEELRVFLEEAAGISKYKERRRETENRIKHTRDNLERVTDLCDELGKQLDRLKRQANSAERYKSLKSQERLYKAQLQALRWLRLSDEIECFDKELNQKKLALESLLTEQNRLDLTIADKRSAYQDANEKLNEVQAQYYKIASEIARLEENIQHQRERKAQLDKDLSQAKDDWQQASQHLEENQQKSLLLNEAIVILEPEVAQMSEAFAINQAMLEEFELKQESWRGQWDAFVQTSAESSKTAHVEQSKIQQIEGSINKLQQRLEKLGQELSHLDIAPSNHEITQLKEEHDLLNAKHEETNLQMESITEQLKTQRLELEKLEKNYHTNRSLLAQNKAKEASLLQLQEAALGNDDKNEKQWLNKNELQAAKRLAQVISVDDGYETALEVALGSSLQALCIDDLNSLEAAFNEIDKGCLTFVEKNQKLTAAVLAEYPALYKKISSEHAICQNLLTGIYVADDLCQALSWLVDIASHESIITKDGILLGHGWCRVVRSKDVSSGVIAREKAIVEIQKQIDIQELDQQEKHDSIAQLKLVIENLDLELAQIQQLRNETFSSRAELRSKIQVKKNRIEQIEIRLKVIDEEVESESEQRETSQMQLLTAKNNWQQAMQAMEFDSEKREELTIEQQSINEHLAQHRRESSQLHQSLHEKELSLKTKQSEIYSINQSIERDSPHLDVLKERIEVLILNEQQTPTNDGASTEQILEEKLELHLIAEEKLNTEKRLLEDLKLSLSMIEKETSTYAESIRNEQSRIDSLRMDRQTVIVRRQTIEETLAETDHQLKILLEEMPSEADEKVWDEELKTFAIKISRLGAINLAAIDEYETESVRKRYLDEQFDDLTSALETLEAAISKIDKETRIRFKDTYEQVNEGFQNLFPRLFGGGQAYLDLTGDDLLDTGVTVMARPPGKRNSTIHLLSGGEKALTAVALVFAIFYLNPAPFCMLDEVDAPLDDINVTRFCSLVKEMSKQVQFIFISHNKVAMEMAEQLHGVTMMEPGVSRIVSVDVEAAIAIAT